MRHVFFDKDQIDKMLGYKFAEIYFKLFETDSTRS